jgi:CheY-like chemotaxis protein
MPNVDGYTATQRIRAEPLFKDLPVIAMTAHATADAREASLAAGMDDHLSKPVQPATLYDTLRAWLPDRRDPDSETRATAAPDTSDTGAPVAYPGLDTESGLHNTAGRRAMYARMLRRFRDRYRAGADPLRAHLHAGERNDAHRWAHTLKGLAQTIGADEVAAAAAAIDATFKDGGQPDAGQLDRLDAALAAAATVMDRYLADVADPADGTAA